jgi:predicted SprT family Zn-dependent metalloprotease
MKIEFKHLTPTDGEDWKEYFEQMGIREYCTCTDTHIMSSTDKIDDIHCAYCNKPTYAVWKRNLIQ